VYRALIEATAFGARAIVERLREHGAPIERVVCCGGIAEKNDLFMQIYADVLGYPMIIAGSPQTPALGAAVSAAVAAGAEAGGYASFAAAQEAMTSIGQRQFTPDPDARLVYDELYAIYHELHDAFGGVAGAPADLASPPTEALGSVVSSMLPWARGPKAHVLHSRRMRNTRERRAQGRRGENDYACRIAAGMRLSRQHGCGGLGPGAKDIRQRVGRRSRRRPVRHQAERRAVRPAHTCRHGHRVYRDGAGHRQRPSPLL
jgi:hypothetical protein